MAGKELFSLFICFGGGIFSLLASILDWDFFFESRKAKFFVDMFGRNGARIFYSLLATFLFVCAYLLIMKNYV